MIYDIVLVPVHDTPREGEVVPVLRRVVDTTKGGHYRLADENATYIEIAETKGLLQVFPLANLLQVIIEERTAPTKDAA